MKRPYHLRTTIAGVFGFVLVSLATPEPASAAPCPLTISNVTVTCDGPDGGSCKYTFSFDATNSGTSSFTISPYGTGSAQFPPTSIPANQTVTISQTLILPCGTASMQLLAAANSTPPCSAQATLNFPACCSASPPLAQAQDPTICRNGQTHVAVPPNTLGTVTWYQTNAPCPTGVVAPNSPWTSFSSGANVITPSLTQSTCFEAVVSIAGCPNVVTNPVTVNVVDPGAGSITCGGNPCPSDLCNNSIVNLHYSNPTAPQGCTFQWEQWNSTAGQWQTINGQTTTTLTAQTLTTSTCPFETFKFRMKSTCPPCGDNYTEADFNVYAQTQAGTLHSGLPLPICQGKSDFITLNGPCGDFVWQSSTTGTTGSFNDITGSNGALIWNTNPLSQTTWYQVTARNGQNGPCLAATSAPIQITVAPKPTVNLTPTAPPAVCAPNQVLLTAAGTPAGGTYHWYVNGLPQGTSTTTYSATVSGNYYVTYQTSCGLAKSNIVKVIISKPVAVIEGACGICSLQTVALMAVPGGGVPNYTFSWTGPSVSPTTGQNVTASAPGTYTVTVTDSLGCTTTATHTINLCHPPLVGRAGKPQTIHILGSATLGFFPTATGGTPPYTYSWSPAAGLNNATSANPIATPGQTTTYTLTVTDANGCVSTSTVTITVQ